MRLVVGIPESQVTREVLEPAAEAVTRLNQQLIEQGQIPTFDEAVKRGMVKWKPEPPGDERFDHGAQVLSRGWGDCDDLAPWRAASARATGEDPGARAVMLRKSPTLWHCVVQMSDGSLQDPSREAGMGKNGAAANAPATPIIQTPQVVGGVKRPHMAVRPVYRAGRVSGWQSRVDLPLSETEAALVQLHYSPVASQAITGACNAIGILADAACTMVDPETLGPIDAIAGLLSGCSPEHVAAICGDDAVDRAMQWLDTAERVCGPLHRRPRSVFVGSFWDDVVDVATSAADAVGHAVDDVGSAIDSVSHDLAPVIDAAKEVLSAAQGVISLIPGIGTGISAAISAGLAALEGGSPLEIAIKTAYGALPIPPGIRDVTDTVLDAVLALAKAGNVEDAVLTAARDRVPEGFPRDVFDTLVHLVVTEVTGKPTVAVATPKDGTNPGDPVQLMQVPVLHITKRTGEKIIQPVFHPLHAATLANVASKIIKPPLTASKAPATSALSRLIPQPPATSAPPANGNGRPDFMAGLPAQVQYVAPAGVYLA